MCEDGGGSDTNPEASVLARSSSFTAAATALPLPHGPESTATSDLPAAMADADGAAYFPPRVQSLKDMRCPSFDARAGQPCDFGASDPAAAPAGLGGAASIHQSSSLSQLSGLAGLYRRHSLASANPQAAMPTGATGAWPVPRHDGVFARDAPAGAMAFGGYHPGDDYTGYPARMPTGIAYQLPMIPAGMYHFGMHPSAMVRQNSMSALPTALLQQQQQQPGYFLGSGVSNGGLAQHHPGAMPYPGSHFSDSAPGMPMPVQPQLTQQYQQQQPASTMPPPLLPAYGPGPLAARMLQPLPMPPTMMQQGKQQNRRQSRRQRMHARRASHPEVSIPGPTAGPAGTVSPAPRLAGAPHSASHPLLPNPATTITPNMPFADMGRGLAYQSLPRGTRVYVVQFKGRRRDMFFVPSKGMEARVIPTLAPKPTSQPAAASFAAAAKGVRAASSAMAVPAPASEPAQKTGGDAKAKLAQGSYVLVEADRGVDLGVIKEELLTAEAVLAFGSALADWASGCSDGSGAGATADGSDDEHPGGAGTSTSAPAAKPPGAGGAAGRDLFVKRIFRVADRQEVADMQGNKLCDEQSALSMCQEMVQQHRLAMCVVDAEFQFDRRKLTFYFTAGRRVDFRELVRDLFRHFKTRIWMCQLNQ
ncbi:hypothetical protein LPJ61_000371 [Coemansia biformis]|uniref:PSP1 C-terminal domain-containing protein n=1 Tax=Coemansia biformis TaxID=1286918 RepID=A0A9W8D0K9_9FUNG|nr:hypothetical protein LPJ61_000371 [Coemansia biformis]